MCLAMQRNANLVGLLSDYIGSHVLLRLFQVVNLGQHGGYQTAHDGADDQEERGRIKQQACMGKDFETDPNDQTVGGQSHQRGAINQSRYL